MPCPPWSRPAPTSTGRVWPGRSGQRNCTKSTTIHGRPAAKFRNAWCARLSHLKGLFDCLAVEWARGRWSRRPALSRRDEGTLVPVEKRASRLRFHLRDQTHRAGRRHHCRPLQSARMILSLVKNSNYIDWLRLWPLSGAMNNRNAYGNPVD